MRRRRKSSVPELLADPFAECERLITRAPLQLLGARIRFESNSPQALRLVDAAYAGLPSHRLSARSPTLRVALRLATAAPRPARAEPAAVTMLSGAGWVGGASDGSNVALICVPQRAALLALSPRLLHYPYHARYELLEFAVYTLASRVQQLVPLHGACVGLNGRGVLLMGASGAGKSTLALLSAMQGFDFVAEDSVFVSPRSMLATGVANFLHVRADSLRWLPRLARAAIRRSPIIRRRSGVNKFEIDLRRGPYSLASAPLKIGAVVFLSSEPARQRALLSRLPAARLRAQLAATQAYAANQPRWADFCAQVARVDAFCLRRAAHPLQSVQALAALLGSGR